MAVSLFPNGGNSGPLSQLVFPPHLIAGLVQENVEPSVVTTLGRRAHLPYGDSAAVSVHDHEAQYVGPGQPKKGSTADAKVTEFHTHWFQKTVRFPTRDIETYRAYGQAFIRDMLRDMLASLPRALDYAVLHAIDARSGVSVPALNPAIHSANTVINADGAPAYAGIDAAVKALYAKGYRPNGVALDAAFASSFVTARAGLTEARLYPNFNPNQVSDLEGLRSVVSETVGARGIEVDPYAWEPISAIVGDWRSLIWDIARPVVLQEFTTGDPDNSDRDLAGFNEIAYRVEVAYTWGFTSTDAFALVTGSPAAGGVGVTIPGVNTVDVETETVIVTDVGVSPTVAAVQADVEPVVALAVAEEPSGEVVVETVEFADNDPFVEPKPARSSRNSK